MEDLKGYFICIRYISMERYGRRVENLLNRKRISNQLRILWPDFEIYDLLGRALTFAEIEQHASFAPLIVNLDLDQETLSFPFYSKKFTHVAIAKRKEVSQNMEVMEVTYAFLTRRNIAVD